MMTRNGRCSRLYPESRLGRLTIIVVRILMTERSGKDIVHLTHNEITPMRLIMHMLFSILGVKWPCFYTRAHSVMRKQRDIDKKVKL